MYTDTGAFLPRISELYLKLLSQGANQSCINKEILKGFQRYTDVLKNMKKVITKFMMKKALIIIVKKTSLYCNFLS